MGTEKKELEARFKIFLNQLPGVEDIDKVIPEETLSGSKRADFLLDNRNYVMEMKNLETDPSWKIEDRVAPHREREEFPLFYWRANLNDALAQLPDGNEIEQKIFHAITRSVQSDIEDANKQIIDTKRVLKIPNACGIVALLNQNIEILDPNTLVKAAAKVLTKKKGGQNRYSNIAFVFIVSETHKLVMGNKTEFLPIILLKGPMAQDFYSAESFLNYLIFQWANWNKLSLCRPKDKFDFNHFSFEPRNSKAVKNLNEGKITRQEYWEKFYEANPYLRPLSEKEFLNYMAQIIKQLKPNFIIGQNKLPDEEMKILFEKFAHAMKEAEHRKLDMKKLEIKKI